MRKKEEIFVICLFLFLNLLKFGESSQSKLDTNLETSITEVERLSLLSSKQFVYDFFNTNVGITTGEGGKTILANAATFPALIGQGLSMVIGLINPCGINLPHIHPRASELWYVIEGEFETGFFSENGGILVMNNVTQGQVTLYPQGVIHFEQNLNCKPAKFIAAFNNQDPGVFNYCNQSFSTSLKCCCCYSWYSLSES